MTSAQIRQSFLDFFKSKGHTIVPSSSLMPDSPNLLFTNAGMNQFVPIFLGQRPPDVSKWAGAIPGKDTRAADTQKCIRAGGKHNDLEDVGLDTYHHTLFEMLGNWSFGDYFKREAIDWAWELITEVWKFPKNRLYATVYSPDKSKGDPSDFDQEAYDFWAAKFTAAGLDPKVHIVNGNKKDNFWMMGDTGPCGPCSEIHVDLTPQGDTKGRLVNQGSAECIEIWNLVFIQFNANQDGTFSPLPAKHVDTGMGFERVTSIIQNTKGFTDFTGIISNYETDIFRPLFDKLEKLSGKKYASTLPALSGSATVPVAGVGVTPTPSPAPGAKYYKRRLPHFERPWAKYMVSFSTRERRQLSSPERDVVLKSLLFGDQQRRYQLYAACVMPDHVHLLFEPQIKERDQNGEPVFWPLPELLHSIKSFTAHEINKLEKTTGPVWENESFDRLIRGTSDLEEKFHYICRNPWESGVASQTEDYPWIWTPDAAARDAQQGDRDGRAPRQSAAPSTDQIALDIAFRVIADHIRTLSFAIADGIQPGNTDRNYVLRRILRRAVRYGRTLDFHEPFFYKLVSVLAENMGHVFPEIRAKQEQVEETIQREEESFNRTLDTGIQLFEEAIQSQQIWLTFLPEVEKFIQEVQGISEIGEVAHGKFGAISHNAENLYDRTIKLKVSEAFPQGGALQALISALWSVTKGLAECPPAEFNKGLNGFDTTISLIQKNVDIIEGIGAKKLSGQTAFKLYDTYGFPLDLTELMARERGMVVDKLGFEQLMQTQKEQSQAAQKKEVIELSQIETTTPVRFVGYDSLESSAKVLETVRAKGKTGVILDASPLYAEMGGQVGDSGDLTSGGKLWRITDTKKTGNTSLHVLGDENAPDVGAEVQISVDRPRRNAIQRHHTVTHLLHWALHEVVSKDATQKGSYVGPDKLTFDFSGAALTPEQIADVELLVNERILENAAVSWAEVKHSDIKGRPDIMQFFGEKYGDQVRVVQIGGDAKKLNGYSMELCGGTHTRATGEIGLFRIVAESAVAAGIRRIEAVSGLEAYKKANEELHLIKTISGKVNSPVGELEKKIESLLAQQKDLEKQLKAGQQKQAAETARGLVAKAQKIGAVSAIVENLGAADGDFLQSIADSLKGQFNGVVILGGTANGAVSLIATVSSELTKQIQAGKIIQTIAPTVGGKGGGRPDNARGGGKDVGKLDEALSKAKALLA